MEEFWKAIDTPAKHPWERGLRTLTSQSASIYDHPHHDFKEDSKVAPHHEVTSSISLKVEFLEISLSEINEATNNFSKCHIGSGGYADVYKAELHVIDIQSLSTLKVKCKEELPKIKKTVAIKKFKDRVDEQAKQGFEAEIKLLTSCKHQNIISLLGFSKENDVLVLVYEFAINGSLASYFESNSKKVNLTWAQRLQICLDTANGINYLHSDMKGKEEIIHRDIKSDNILLDENLNAKVADFGLSKFRPTKKVETYLTKIIAGTDVYMDPEYWYESKYKMESDIYSFGVVLYEVLCGRLAYDPIYQNRMGLAPIARRHYKDSTIKNLIDPKIIEEVHNDMFTINRGLSQDPFESISKIAFQCIAETHVDRPPMAVIIKELQDAVNLQEFKSATNNFSTILSATNNFSNERLITEDSFGKLYNGELLWNENLMNFTVRRLDRMHVQGEELQNEISTLKSLKHKHIISVLGHYDGSDEKIIIYEHAFHGTLDQHLSDPSLTWAQRVKICLGVAHALSYIYYDVIHCDINSSKIILDEDWEPKIYGFELSTNYPQSLRHRLLYSRYFDTNNMTPESDVYSFGVLLLEILCGKKLVITNVDPEELNSIIDPNLREQMDTEWLRKFKDLAFECLNRRSMQQPTMDEIVKELEEVLHLQWEHENDVHSKVEDEDEGTSSNTFKMELLKIPLSEIKRATNDFNEGCLVGSGGYANVYKAELDVLDIQCWSSMRGECKEDLPKIRKTVAIKRIFTRGDSQDERVFTAELEILASCKHPNIVSILGFSSEDDERILVIEYATYGSLGDYYNSKRFSLTWAQRLQICIDAANAISYLHTDMEGKPWLIHRDIKSDNILLDENLNTKLADFGLSKFQHRKKAASVVFSKNLVGTLCYIDPEYLTAGKYKRESDTYSFGVVLFEVLSGRAAYDPLYTRTNEIGLAPIARKRFKEGTLKKIIDSKMTDEDDDLIFSLNKGPNKDSFDVFSKIAYRCLAETQAKRPTMELVISELQNSLKLQGDTVVLSKFLLHDIVLATDNFAETFCIGLDTNGTVYKAELQQFVSNTSSVTKGKNDGEPSKKHIIVAIKRITSRSGGQGKQGFVEEFEMRAYKHPNIVTLLGFCDEGDGMMLVYEHIFERSLDEYMKNVDNMCNFSWTHRLRMCLEIARGLHHLHTKMANQSIIHTDIRSANILLDKNGVAKIGYFVISSLHPRKQEKGMKVYEDPGTETTGKMKKESDTYSLGVVLFEIFCWRVAYDPVYIEENGKGLAPIAKQCYDDGTIQRIMDPRLKEETGHEDISTSNILPKQDSLDAFLKIAYECLGDEAAKRPTLEMVIKELETALKLQDPKQVE